jgi:signal transduction histidine kinase
MAGLVSARFRVGMRPLAFGTALCVAFSAPLADFLLERQDVSRRAQLYAARVAAQLAGTPDDAGILRVAEQDQRSGEDVARVEVRDAGGRLIAQAKAPASAWPLVTGSAPLEGGRGSVTVAMGEPGWLARDLLLVGVFGALGLVLGLALYFFPLRLFREEDLVLLFARRSIKAAEDERLRLSRDLHDGVGQTLGTAAIAVARLLARTGPGAEAAEAARLIDAALEELRHVSRGLRPPTLDDLGLGPSIAALAQEAARTGLRADVHIGALPRLDPELEQTCFRLAQEALANVVRHAQARNFHLSLSCGPDALVLAVDDDGRGFQSVSGLGLGLVGARERATSLSGTFTVESAPGRGTRLRASLPLRGRA